MEFNYEMIEKKFVDYLISIIGPNQEQDTQRETKYKSFKKIILNAFVNEHGIIPHVFSFGSFPLRTYLPD